jgi:hypothetical protein
MFCDARLAARASGPLDVRSGVMLIPRVRDDELESDVVLVGSRGAKGDIFGYRLIR